MPGVKVALRLGETDGGAWTVVRMEDLKPGIRVEGLASAGSVELVQVEPYGDQSALITYRDDTGLAEQVVFSADLEALQLVSDAGAARFNGNPHRFRLGLEARRIKMAAQFDQMLAVSTSDIDPLPHQIEAVYGHLLAKREPLRFLLADDPGAGKTIMAGLYAKELMLRGALERCLIVAPGGLVEQWQDELLEKFDLRFEILTKGLIESTPVGENPFAEHPLLIARMDQLARNDDLVECLVETPWDLAIVDEAHRMSAHYYGQKVERTKRYVLGEKLGEAARHFLLMTATPHTGHEEDFQLFLRLLDADRFEGKFRPAQHHASTEGLMLRRVKEDLRTFEGRKLFPERRASTVPYSLSGGEIGLYEDVTEYVRTEMNRADQLKSTGDRKRGNTVGFALTVLQRRLASSSEAILKSLERRRNRLRAKLREAEANPRAVMQDVGPTVDIEDEDWDGALDEWNSEELEDLEDQVSDAATAARTAAELRAETAALDRLVERARRVRLAESDRKWQELRDLLQDSEYMYDDHGQRRKLLIFTEHRDTLNYLVGKIRELLGRVEAVESIHGGVNRKRRHEIQDRFRQDPELSVLVATDAAGEGLNLQRANLMVNYDLPWNPNRIEQRFGRIHRIGQTEVCHLWNLVADNTREGSVFTRLLVKIEQQRRALGGQVFDVLGDAFADRPLRSLLMDAIRYGDQPEVKAQLEEIIDAGAGANVEHLIKERALHKDVYSAADVEQTRLRMEEARARRLQPHYLRAFFDQALADVGGKVTPREPGRYAVSGVPKSVRERHRRGRGKVLARYERVTFDRDHIGDNSGPKADLLAPGHPLMDAVIADTIDRTQADLAAGTVLIDRLDAAETPRLMVAMRQEITDGRRPAHSVWQAFEFCEFTPDGDRVGGGSAPYLDYEAPGEGDHGLVSGVASEPWLADAGSGAVAWIANQVLPERLAAVQSQVDIEVGRTRAMVVERLTQEVNNLYAEQMREIDRQQRGKQTQRSPEHLGETIERLERRKTDRLTDLARAQRLSPKRPDVVTTALVIPKGLLDRLAGHRDQPEATYLDAARLVEDRAVKAVKDAELALGRDPEVQARNHKGYDIQSLTPDRHYVHIEVKGCGPGSETFTVTRSELLTGKNADQYRLALVTVDPRQPPATDEVRYVLTDYAGIELQDFAAAAVVLEWGEYFERRGEDPC